MINRKKKILYKSSDAKINLKRDQEAQDQLRFSRRVVLVLLAIICGIIGLFSRSYYLQVKKHHYYRTRSKKNRVKLLILPPIRGNIFDCNGIPLSKNILSYNLVVNRAKSNEIDKLIEKIPQYMRFNEEDKIRYEEDKKKKNYNQEVIVRSDLTDSEINHFLVDLYLFPGFDVVSAYRRYYPYGDLTAHVVGYINNINKNDLKKLDRREYFGTVKIGRTGIEKKYENILHGRAGFRQAEVSRTGKVIRIIEQQDPVPGHNVHLSLDLNLQRIISEELEKENYDGAGVAINPRNGEMLAMVSNPSFDANLFVEGISFKDYNKLRNSPHKNLFNRALNGNYSPASTIKPMMALAALHHYTITPDISINCSGRYSIPEYKSARKFYCWKRSGHGEMKTISSISRSCDVYYYTVGKELGIARIHDYLSQFGLGRRTGIDLPNESSGILPSKDWKMEKHHKPWYIGDTINASIGQGYMLTTPLQLAYFASIIGSRGNIYYPHFVTSVGNPIYGNIKSIKKQKFNKGQIKQNNPNAWQVISDAMIDVISGRNGIASKIKIDLPFKIAGKTGTAQLVSLPKGRRQDKKNIPKDHIDNSVFITYAPADNPIIALSIILENAGGGSEAAAPVAIRVLERYFKTKQNKK